MRARRSTIRAGALLLAPALLSAAWAAAADERPAPLGKPYEALLQRSIFSKDRRAAGAQAAGTQTTKPAVTLTPEQSIWLRGVLCPDEEYVAFVENIQTRQVTVVKAGDDLAGGRVAAITLDTMAYDAGGKVHQIRLGQNLAGETTAPEGYAASTTAPAAGAESGAAAADPSQAAIIERMRQKRLREGGR